MKELMQGLRDSSIKAILEADDIELLESLRVKYLGKKGELTAILQARWASFPPRSAPSWVSWQTSCAATLRPPSSSARPSLAAKLMELKLEREAVDVTHPRRDQ